MESLKLIPQAFFDLIGRVVPGAVAILAALLLAKAMWETWLDATLGKTLATSSTISVLFFLGCAYVAGQLLSPLAKLVQRAGEWRCFKPGEKSADFDWLRAHHPEAGAYCAKIRAEFTMHNGLAVVLLVSAAIYPFSEHEWRWAVQIGLVGGGLLAAYRGRVTRDTFHETVIKFADAVSKGIPKGDEPAVAPGGAGHAGS